MISLRGKINLSSQNLNLKLIQVLLKIANICFGADEN